MSTFINIPDYNWQQPVTLVTDLPTYGNQIGDARVVTSQSSIYIWNGSAWIEVTPTGGGTQWLAPVANMAALPATGNVSGDVRVTLDTGTIWEWNGTMWIAPLEGAPPWGSITGTLSNQTDLQNALNAKANLSGAVFTGEISSPSIKVAGVTSGYVDLITSSSVSSYIVSLPGAQGGANSFLINDGSGNLTWTSASPSVVTNNIDGGNSATLYTTSQLINGGSP